MGSLKSRLMFSAIVAVALAAPTLVSGQSWGDRLKKKAEAAAKRKVEERTEKRAGEAADKALDKVECAATDAACEERKAAAAQAGGATPAGAVNSTGTAGRAGEGTWLNYDFVPGDRVIFTEDFTKDNVGDFPRRLVFKKGNAEVAEWQGARWLHTTTYGTEFELVLPEKLPERFTLEFDLAQRSGQWSQVITIVMPAGFAASHSSLFCAPDKAGLTGGASSGTGRPYGSTPDLVTCRVMVDGGHVKVYVNERRVANVPNARLGRSDRLHFELYASENSPVFIRNIRVAGGGKKLYDALAESGRVATQGIYFDSVSDRIRPESTPTLKEIGQMLTDHSDLKLTIEGHTDNVGHAAANQQLSERRAAAVKAYLVEKHGIDAARLSSAGLGDKKPVAKNDTPEGRQQNRRVELVKM